MENKHKQKAVTAIILFLVTALLVWQVVGWNKNKNPDIAGALMESKGIDTSYDSFIKHSINLTLAEMKLNYKLNLNQEFRKDYLNIYVVNFDSLDSTRKIAGLSYKEFASFAKDNFIALPPNLIIIDKYFLSYLILNCYNETIAFYQALDYATREQILNGANPNEILQTHSAIATYLSIGNFNWFKNKDPQAISIDSLAVTIVREVVSDTIGRKDVLRDFVTYLIPITAHEIAHIKYNDNKTMGWSDFKELLQSQLSVYKEEERADDLAFKTVRNFIKQSSDIDRDCTSLISFCRTMRNMVITDTYRDFRNMDPADLIVTLEQKRELTDEELQLPFQYFQRVERGYENSLPAMTEEEFDSFIKKLYKSGSSLAHRHMLQRCQALLNIVDSATDSHVRILDSYLDLLSISKGDTKKEDSLFMDEVSDASIHLTKKKVINKLENQVVFYKAVNYKNNHIEVGLLKDSLGYIELHGDSTNLNYAVLVIKTRGKDGWIDEAAVGNMVIFIRFIANLYTDQNEGFLAARHAYAQFRNEKGALPTFYMQADSNTIKYTPVNNSFFIKVEVFKKPNSDMEDSDETLDMDEGIERNNGEPTPTNNAFNEGFDARLSDWLTHNTWEMYYDDELQDDWELKPSGRINFLNEQGYWSKGWSINEGILQMNIFNMTFLKSEAVTSAEPLSIEGTATPKSGGKGFKWIMKIKSHD